MKTQTGMFQPMCRNEQKHTPTQSSSENPIRQSPSEQARDKTT